MGSRPNPPGASTYDGAILPTYAAMDCQVIVARIIWASEARVRDDRLEQIVGDVSAFLERSLVDKPGAPVLLPRSF